MDETLSKYSHSFRCDHITQNFRTAYETKFQSEWKTKLNQLRQIKGMTHRFNALLITFRNAPTRDHRFIVRFLIVTQRECSCLVPLKMISISSFPTLQTSSKLQPFTKYLILTPNSELFWSVFCCIWTE